MAAKRNQNFANTKVKVKYKVTKKKGTKRKSNVPREPFPTLSLISGLSSQPCHLDAKKRCAASVE